MSRRIRHVALRRDAMPTQKGLARDPVCGMDVVPETAAGSIEHDGRTIYFCSRHCLEKFKADPARYAEARRPITHPGLVVLNPAVPAALAPAPAPAGDRATPARCIPEIVRDRPGRVPDLRDGARADDRRGR